MFGFPVKRALFLLAFLLAGSVSLTAQSVDFKILQPFDRVYYNSNTPTVEVMARAGRYFNSHGELECTISSGDSLLYRFSQYFMAAMGDSAKLSFSFNLTPGFYRVELKSEGRPIGGCVIGYEPEMIEADAGITDDGGGFSRYWNEKIKELSTYPKLIREKKIKELSGGVREIYRVSINSYGGRSVECYYSVPKQKGRYKAVVRLVNLSDSLTFEKLGRMLASDTLSDRIIFAAQPEESIDVVRFIDFLQEKEEVSLGNIFTEGCGEAAARALVASAIDRRIAAVALFAPVFAEYTGLDTPLYGNLYVAAENIDKPLLFGVDMSGTVADPSENFALYNRFGCEKSYYIFLDNGRPPLWDSLKRNFFDKNTK